MNIKSLILSAAFVIAFCAVVCVAVWGPILLVVDKTLGL